MTTIPEALDRVPRSRKLTHLEAAWLIKHLRAQPGADGVSTELIALPSGRTALITLHHEEAQGRIHLTAKPHTTSTQSEEWKRANRLYRALLGATPLSSSQREVIHRHLVRERGVESATELGERDLRELAQDLRSLSARALLDILRSYEEVTA